MKKMQYFISLAVTALMLFTPFVRLHAGISTLEYPPNEQLRLSRQTITSIGSPVLSVETSDDVLMTAFVDSMTLVRRNGAIDSAEVNVAYEFGKGEIIYVRATLILETGEVIIKGLEDLQSMLELNPALQAFAGMESTAVAYNPVHIKLFDSTGAVDAIIPLSVAETANSLLESAFALDPIDPTINYASSWKRVRCILAMAAIAVAIIGSTGVGAVVGVAGGIIDMVYNCPGF